MNSKHNFCLREIELVEAMKAHLGDAGDLTTVDEIADALSEKYVEFDRQEFKRACGYYDAEAEDNAPGKPRYTPEQIEAIMARDANKFPRPNAGKSSQE